MSDQLPALVSTQEQDQISRLLLAWLNEYPGLPVTAINYEFLAEGQTGMALSVIQGAYKTKRYLRGRYEAQYQFKVIYRLQPSSTGTRLKADEFLDTFGDWAVNRKDLPMVGAGKKVVRLTVNSRSALFGRYENGDEDHQILMTMDYISM